MKPFKKIVKKMSYQTVPTDDYDNSTSDMNNYHYNQSVNTSYEQKPRATTHAIDRSLLWKIAAFILLIIVAIIVFCWFYPHAKTHIEHHSCVRQCDADPNCEGDNCRCKINCLCEHRYQKRHICKRRCGVLHHLSGGRYNCYKKCQGLLYCSKDCACFEAKKSCKRKCLKDGHDMQCCERRCNRRLRCPRKCQCYNRRTRCRRKCRRKCGDDQMCKRRCMRRRCRRYRCRRIRCGGPTPMLQGMNFIKASEHTQLAATNPDIIERNAKLDNLVRMARRFRANRRTRRRTRPIPQCRPKQPFRTLNQCNSDIDLDRKFESELGQQTVAFHNNAPIERPNGQRCIVELFRNQVIEGNATFSNFNIPYSYSGVPNACADYGMAVLEMHFKTFETGQLSPNYRMFLNNILLASGDIPGVSFFDDGNDQFPMEKEITHLRNGVLNPASSGIMKFQTVPLDDPTLFDQFKQMRIEVCARIVFYKQGRVQQCLGNNKRNRDEELLNNPPDMTIPITPGSSNAKLLFFNPLAPDPSKLYNVFIPPNTFQTNHTEGLYLEVDVEEQGFTTESVSGRPVLGVLLDQNILFTYQMLKPGFDPLSYDSYAWNPINGHSLQNRHYILNVSPFATYLADGNFHVLSFFVLFGQSNPTSSSFHHMAGNFHVYKSSVPIEGAIQSYQVAPFLFDGVTLTTSSEVCSYVQEYPSGDNRKTICVKKMIKDVTSAMTANVPPYSNVTISNTNQNEEIVTVTDDDTNEVIHRTERRDNYPADIFVGTRFNGTFGNLFEGFYFDCNFRQHHNVTYIEKTKGCKQYTSKEESEVATSVFCYLNQPNDLETWFGNVNYACYKNTFEDQETGPARRVFNRQWAGESKVLTQYNRMGRDFKCLGSIPDNLQPFQHGLDPF